MHEFIYNQEAGSARPSILQSMISNLPDESDPKRAEAEEMAKAVAATAYGGKSRNFFSFAF